MPADRARKPTQLSTRTWRAAVLRSWREFRDDDLTFLAAALTYYGVLSLFPALLVLVSILGLVGPSATQPLIDHLSELTPGAARDVLVDGIQNVERASGAAGFAFVLGIVGALWSASGYVGGFMKATNIIYEIEE